MLKIEWAQLLTNIVGFLILFWGLRRFAWGPILGLLDERRQRIQNEIDSAAGEKRKADELRREYDLKLKEIDALSRKRIEEATREAARTAAEMRENARAETRAMFEKARADVEGERAKARVALRNDIVEMVVLGVEKVVHDRMSPAKQEELVGKFIDELEGIKA